MQEALDVEAIRSIRQLRFMEFAAQHRPEAPGTPSEVTEAFHQFVAQRCPELPEARSSLDREPKMQTGRTGKVTESAQWRWWQNRVQQLEAWSFEQWQLHVEGLLAESWSPNATWLAEACAALSSAARDDDQAIPRNQVGWPEVPPSLRSTLGTFTGVVAGANVELCSPVVDWSNGPTVAFTGLNQNQVQDLQQRLILDFIRQVPPYALHFHVYDPDLLGRALSPFGPIHDAFPSMFGDRTWTGDLDELAKNLRAEIARRQREVGASGKANAWALNHSLGRMAIPVDVVLLSGLERERAEVLAQLNPVFSLGPPALVYTVVLSELPWQDAGPVLDASIGSNPTLKLDAQASAGTIGFSQAASWQPRGIAPLLGDGRLGQLTGAVEEYRSTLAERTAVRLDQVVGGDARSSELGLEVPIGTAGDVRIDVRFGDDPVHGFVVGDAGSGKSNLLHVLIHSAVSTYGPDELQLFLVDMKEGVEFTNVYAVDEAHARFPNIEIVAADADPEFGVGVLQEAARRMAERGELFRSAGVRSFPEYRRQGNVLPRILVVVDEFQNLFRGGDGTRDQAWELVAQIAREGRSFGVHLLFATQTFLGVQGGSHSLAAGAYEQFGLRLALRCSEEDSKFMLDDASASSISNAGEAFISMRRGTDDNRRLQVARFEGVREEDQASLHEAIVFDGRPRPWASAASQVQETARFAKLPLGTGTNLGEAPTFDIWPERHRNLGILSGGTGGAQALVHLLGSVAGLAGSAGWQVAALDLVSPASPIRDGLDELWADLGPEVPVFGSLDELPAQAGDARSIVLAVGIERCPQLGIDADTLRDLVAADAAAGRHWILSAGNLQGFQAGLGRGFEQVCSARMCLSGAGPDGPSFLNARYVESKGGRAYFADSEQPGQVRSLIPFSRG